MRFCSAWLSIQDPQACQQAHMQKTSCKDVGFAQQADLQAVAFDLVALDCLTARCRVWQSCCFLELPWPARLQQCHNR